MIFITTEAKIYHNFKMKNSISKNHLDQIGSLEFIACTAIFTTFTEHKVTNLLVLYKNINITDFEVTQNG